MSEKGVAIVTGGTGGIGSALVRQLAKEGYDIAIADISVPDGTEQFITSITSEYGIAAAPFQVDLTDYNQCTSLVQQVIETLGSDITVLINCAGISHGALFLTEETPEWMKKILETNLLSQLYLVHAVLPYMVESKLENKNIINFSSTAALMGLSPTISYCASKMGVIGMTKAMANEFAPYRIRVNAIAPGATKTQMMKEQSDKVNLTIEENAKVIAKSMPLGVICEPEDMACAMSYLLNARVTTGMTIAPNAGMTMYSF